MQKKHNKLKYIIIIELIILVYMIFALTTSIYKKYQINNYITEFEKNNQQLIEDNKTKKAEFLYYKSDKYAEKIAKQNFSLLNYGEEVIVLPPENDIDSDFNYNLPNKIVNNNNLQNWHKFLFDK